MSPPQSKIESELLDLTLDKVLLRLEEGENLPNTDQLNLSLTDAYVKVSLEVDGGLEQAWASAAASLRMQGCTSATDASMATCSSFIFPVRWDSLNPSWHQNATLLLPRGSPAAKLRVVLADKGLLGDTDIINVVLSLPLPERSSGWVRHHLPVEPAGKLRLCVASERSEERVVVN